MRGMDPAATMGRERDASPLPASAVRVESLTYLGERGQKFLFQVGGGFQADREADQAVADSVFAAFVGRHEFMRRTRGVRQRRAGVGQRRRKRDLLGQRAEERGDS